ncbi:hypothetical protein FHG87_014947 [Trinorchestia longiramus]|nr:hypothetical protein FHG87_014947 [Trinorchestia longiramus]
MEEEMASMKTNNVLSLEEWPKNKKSIWCNTLTPKWYVCVPLRLGSVIFSDPSSDYAYKVKFYTNHAIGGNVLNRFLQGKLVLMEVCARTKLGLLLRGMLKSLEFIMMKLSVL